MLPRLLAFSGKARSGKDTLSYLIEQYGYINIKFSDSLKDLVCDIIEVNRKTLEDIKDTPLVVTLSRDNLLKIHEKTSIPIETLKEFHGKKLESPRELLQFLGTDIIRRFIPDWHIKSLISKIDFTDPTKKYVNSDVRFTNELETLKGLGATIFRIHRPDCPGITSQHVSETELSSVPMDTILNDGTKMDLYNNFMAYFQNELRRVRT
jgi:hypothetical protein